MPEMWVNFGVNIAVQLTFFVAYAYYWRRLADVPRLLGLGVLIGTVVGLVFDYVLGMYFGIYSYTFGFGFFNLLINGALSYGIFAAHILLMQQARLLHIYFVIVLMVVVYETVNIFFRVWTWEYDMPIVPLFFFLTVGYLAGAMLVATISHFVFGKRFQYITNSLRILVPKLLR